MASFHIHPELYRFFERTQSNIVSQVLIHQGSYTTDEGDWVRKEPGVDVVSYIPRNKIKYLDPGIDPFNDEKLRIKLRVGRFASKFLCAPACREAGMRDKNVEEFVNLYKSYFNCDTSKLQVIEGKEILKYYDMNYYARIGGGASGTLWASCMRYPEKNRFMEIYTKNANCKMLIYLQDDGKLRSRALLWEDAKDKYGNVYKVMDRIYSLYDHDVNFFKDWAAKNGYLSKTEQSSKSEQFFTRDGKNIRLHLSVHLENHRFKVYPYFDTFKFYDPETGNFGNSESFKYQHYLVQNWGGLEPEQRESAPDFEDDGQDRQRNRRNAYGSTIGSFGRYGFSARQGEVSHVDTTQNQPPLEDMSADDQSAISGVSINSEGEVEIQTPDRWSAPIYGKKRSTSFKKYVDSTDAVKKKMDEYNKLSISSDIIYKSIFGEGKKSKSKEESYFVKKDVTEDDMLDGLDEIYMSERQTQSKIEDDQAKKSTADPVMPSKSTKVTKKMPKDISDFYQIDDIDDLFEDFK